MRRRAKRKWVCLRFDPGIWRFLHHSALGGSMEVEVGNNWDDGCMRARSVAEWRGAWEGPSAAPLDEPSVRDVRPVSCSFSRV